MIQKYLLWLGITVLLFAGLSVATHASLNLQPKNVVIALDTSYALGTKLAAVQSKLDTIFSQKYASFVLTTDKGWEGKAGPGVNALSQVRFYGPVDLAGFAAGKAVLDGAGELYFILDKSAEAQTAAVQGRYPGAHIVLVD